MKNKKYSEDHIKKWIEMTPEEFAIIISESINGKPHYSDRSIALGMALKYSKNKI